MQALILIGGRGTRLGSLVDDLPKPLLPVAGRPFLDHLLFQLKRHGFTHCLLLAGYKVEEVRRVYGKASDAGARFNMRIDIVSEDQPLGTGGALAHAAGMLADEFLLLNGDSFFNLNVLDLFVDRKGAERGPRPLVRMALRRVDDARRYGLVEIDGDYVRAFHEKPDERRAGLVNGGVYWMHRDVLRFLPTGASSLETDIFPELMRQGVLAARVYDGFFIDIGVPKDFSSAQKSLNAALRAPAVFFDRDNTLILDKGYTHKPEQLVWYDGVPQMIKRLNDAGFYVFVVTNQAGVAKGHYDEENVCLFHQYMNERLRQFGAHIDAFRYCPHHEDGSVTRYAKACSWRKPKAGMMRDLLAHWPIKKGDSIVFGDKKSDIQAGSAAGLDACLVRPGEIVAAVDAFLAGGQAIVHAQSGDRLCQ